MIHSSDHAAIQAELDRLADLSLDEMKARFLELRGIPLPKFMRRELMIKAVAHAIREAAFGGLNPETRKRLDQLVRQIVPTGERAPPPPNRIKPGTRLLREWQGTVHEVMVVKDGFVWQGEVHRSLSEIARRITGTRWNGWVFFGLKKTASGKSRDMDQAKPASLQRTPRAARASTFMGPAHA
jgi:hypothetical protein